MGPRIDDIVFAKIAGSFKLLELKLGYCERIY